MCCNFWGKGHKQSQHWPGVQYLLKSKGSKTVLFSKYQIYVFKLILYHFIIVEIKYSKNIVKLENFTTFQTTLHDVPHIIHIQRNNALSLFFKQTICNQSTDIFPTADHYKKIQQFNSTVNQLHIYTQLLNQNCFRVDGCWLGFKESEQKCMHLEADNLLFSEERLTSSNTSTFY